MRSLSRTLQRPRLAYRVFSRDAMLGRRGLANNGFFRVSEEVREALQSKKPVVALETTIYTHGFPYPENVALASLLESVVRVNGGVPATIGILDGVARVGLNAEEIIRLTSSAGHATTLKLSRRDLSYVCGLRLTGRSFNGGTTIASTMLLAHLAGIKVFGTGGLGGVHRGAESSMDISADLTELGRTPVTVIASGCKSFLDIPRTLEYLETEGATVGTFADGREGNVNFPAFWSRDSGVKSPLTIQDEIEAAAIIYAQHALKLSSGILFANPVPLQAAIPKDTMDGIIERALEQAERSNIRGKDNTPFVLAKVKELSEGMSIPANRALIESNVRRATIVARELAVLETQQTEAQGAHSGVLQAEETPAHSLQKNEVVPISDPPRLLVSTSQERSACQIVVAGALAVDFSCDYAPISDDSPDKPALRTSNPATINQTLGGVAHNIAKAAHYLGALVQLQSAVGEDLSGRAALGRLSDEGISVSGIKIVAQPARTAQYVAINDSRKDLVLAMADMKILEAVPKPTVADVVREAATHAPKVLVLDANWNRDAIQEYLKMGRAASDIITIFEPVSTAKSVRIFPAAKDVTYPIVDIITPNEHELAALYEEASSMELFGQPSWFANLDALGIPSSGLRAPLALTTSPALVDHGIPQRAIKLLPFFPTVLTKLGPKGVLLTQLIRPEDAVLSDSEQAQYVLSRNMSNDANVGGLYVRLFPANMVAEREIVSVNGVGDTLVGALATGIAKGLYVRDIVPFAQEAAVLSLKSQESVSPALKGLEGKLMRL